MADVNNFGIKITKPGFDVRTAGDLDLIFSSSWPALPVAFETTTTGGASATVNHGLTFTPFTLAWSITAGMSQKGFPGGAAWPDVDSSKVYLTGTSGTIHVKCFNIDLGTNVTYPTLRTPFISSGVYSPDYGMKVSKPGKDFSSTDLRDFIIHSRCQSPLVQAVAFEQNAAGGTLVYTATGGYTPWIFGYTRSAAGKFHAAPYFSQSYPKLTIDTVGTTFSLTYAFGDTAASIVVLRDPMFAATDVNVSY